MSELESYPPEDGEDGGEGGAEVKPKSFDTYSMILHGRARDESLNACQGKTYDMEMRESDYSYGKYSNYSSEQDLKDANEDSHTQSRGKRGR